MSVFQRFRHVSSDSNSKTKSSNGKNKNPSSKEVENISEYQPNNPFSELQTLQYHKTNVRLLVKIDERRFASACDDCKIAIWDVQSGRLLEEFCGHQRPVTCLLAIPKSDELADSVLLSGSSDKRICMWDLTSGDCKKTLVEHGTVVRCLLDIESDSGIFCSGGEDVCLWGCDGSLLSVCQRSENEDDIELMTSIGNNMIICCIDRQLKVFVATDTPMKKEAEKNVRLLKSLPLTHKESVKCLLKVSRDQFASGSLDGTIILWSSDSLIPLRYFNCVEEYKGTLHLYPYSVQYMACVEDRYIIAAIGNGYCVYDTITGYLVAEKENAHYSKILSLTFVCDGALLATSSEDGTIRLWGTLPSGCENQGLEKYFENGESSGPVKKLMGVHHEGPNQYRQDSFPVEPQLLGDCLAHTGAVQTLLDFGSDGFVSGGVDGVVALWKNTEIQQVRKNQLVREIVLGVDVD